jgi:hypothetical protein
MENQIQDESKSPTKGPKKAYQCQSASQVDVYSSRLDVRDQLEGYPCGKAYMITMQTGMAR